MGNKKSPTRRDYLKTSAAGLIPIGLAKTSFEDKTTIPLLKSGDEIIKSTTVPTKWREHVIHVEKTLKRFRQQIQGTSGYHSTRIESASDTIRGRRKKKIVIEVDTNELPSISLNNTTSNGPFPEQYLFSGAAKSKS